jgi:sugar lactone lactonase YvrE
MIFDAEGALLVSSRDTNAVGRYDRGVVVSLSATSSTPVSVPYATADGTATAPGDYTAETGTVTFTPGQTSRRILLVTHEEPVLDGNETFSVQLGDATGGTLATHTANVTIVDPVRQLSVADTSAMEGDTTAHYRGAFVDDDLGGQFHPITFGPDGNLYTSVGTGVGYNTIRRYNGTTGAFMDTFASGPINGVREIAFHAGSMYVASAWSNEVLRFDTSTGAFLGAFVTAGSGGINAPVGLAFGPDGNLYVSGWGSNNVVRYDGTSGAPLGTYVPSGSGGLNLPEGLSFDPSGSYLYVASSGTNQILEYNAQTGAYLGVAANAGLSIPMDVRFGPDGLMYVASYGNNRILRYTAGGAYLDDFVPAGSGGMSSPYEMTFGPDGDLYVTATLQVTATGNQQILRFGTENEAVFPVSISTVSTLPLTVNYATADGTAVTGREYTATSGTLTLAPGVTTGTIRVPILDNGLVEPNLTFTLNLSNPVAATFARSQGVGTISDSDGPATFYVVNDATPSAGGTNTAYKYQASGSQQVGYGLSMNNLDPRGVATTTAGTTVWVADANENVYAYNNQGVLLGSWAAGGLPIGAQVTGIATNGTDIWLVDAASASVYKYAGAASRLSGSQKSASSFHLVIGPAGNGHPQGIVTDGSSFWVVDGSSLKVFKYSLTGSSLGRWAIDPANAHPTGLTINPNKPSDIWIVDNGSLRVYQYTAAASRTSGNQNAAATFSLAAGDTNPQGISAAAATRFTLSAPSSATVGSAFNVTVTAQDGFNNTVTGYSGTVHFMSSDGQAALPADYPFTTGPGGDNGVHTFSATLKTAGNQTLTATDTITPSITRTSNSIAVSAPATHFAVSAPSATTAGNAFDVTVTALDGLGNTTTGYTGKVHFSTTDGGGATLPADYTFVAADNGTHTFTGAATLVTAGNQTVTATDTATTSLVGTSSAIAVSPAAASDLAVSAPGNVTAGAAFSVTVTAQDPHGNTATGYRGTLHFTSTDGGAGVTVPADYTFTAGDNGVHTFANGVTLVTAANQTVTATDTVASSITGTSGAIGVSAAAINHFLVGAPATAITGTAFSFSVTAVDAFNNPVTSYSGTVHFTSSDSAASLPANSTLSNGTGSYSATLNKSGSQTITAADTVTSSPTGTSPAIAVRGLIVTSFMPTPTGFTVTFSKPFVNSSTSPVHLYDAASASYGPADVTLVGSSGTIKGSLLIDPSSTSFTFVKTNLTTGGGTSGVLAAGTYTVTLVSGPTAFKDTTGAPLDGTNDGTNSHNYSTAFTVAPPGGVVVTIPDFARGPDGGDAMNVPNNSSNGLPIALSNGAGVTDATFVLHYNANLLSITGGTVNSALSGATFTVTTSGSGASAQATIVFHSPTALASGAVRLGGLQATVPSNAPYKAKALLHWSSLSLNNGGLAAIGDDGVQVVAFLDDTSGDGTYTSADSVLLARVASGADSGFATFPVLDPTIVSDLNGDGRLTAADGGLLNNYLAGNVVAQLPPYPGVPSNNLPGPDPMLSIPSELRVSPDGTVRVPVNIDDPHPAGSSGLTQAQLALTFDPTLLRVSTVDIHLGSVPASVTGWTLQSEVNAATGQIGITLFSVTPIPTSVGGSLVTMDFHLQPAGPGAAETAIQLVDAVNPTGRRVIRTALDDNQGVLRLDPASREAAGPGSVPGRGLLAPPAVSGDSLGEETTLPNAAPDVSAVTAADNRPAQVEGSVADGAGAPPRVAIVPTDAGSTVPTSVAPPQFVVEEAPPVEPVFLGVSLTGSSTATQRLVEQVFRDLGRGVGDPLGQRFASSERTEGVDQLLSSWPSASRTGQNRRDVLPWGERSDGPDGLQAIDHALLDARGGGWQGLLEVSLPQPLGREAVVTDVDVLNDSFAQTRGDSSAIEEWDD